MKPVTVSFSGETMTLPVFIAYMVSLASVFAGIVCLAIRLLGPYGGGTVGAVLIALAYVPIDMSLTWVFRRLGFISPARCHCPDCGESIDTEKP